MTVYHKVEYVAQTLNVSPNAIYAEIKRGALEATRIGRLIRISQEQLTAYLKRQQGGAG